MKKISLYMAMFAIAMSSCSKDVATEQAGEKQTLKAVFCSQDGTRMTFNPNDKKSSMYWEASDAFVTFKSVEEISETHKTFYVTESASNVATCYTENPFKAEDITYAIFPDTAANTEFSWGDLQVLVPSELKMNNSRNTVLFGKYEKVGNVDQINFYPTMGMLELNFTTLDGFDALQIKANRPIASTSDEANYASLPIPANPKDAAIVLPDYGSKTILLTKDAMDGNETTVYCPIPAGDDYSEITVSFVNKIGGGNVVSAPYKTIVAKKETFSIAKKVYALDCTYPGTVYVEAGLPSWNEKDLTETK